MAKFKEERGYYNRKTNRIIISGFVEGHHIILSYPTRGSKDNTGYVDICRPKRSKHSLHAKIVYDKEMSYKEL